MSSTCHLCAQIRGEEDGDLIAELLSDRPYERRVAFETSSFAVLPSLGAVAPGHLLICPVDHLCSFANIDVDLTDEFVALRSDTTGALTHLTGLPVHTFEHGMAHAGGRTLCTVDHAHLHLVPAPVSVDPRAEVPLTWIEIEDSLSALRAVAQGHEYLQYRQPDGRNWVALAPPDGFPSQLLRRIFATAMGREDRWDWREQPDAEEANTLWLELRAESSV